MPRIDPVPPIPPAAARPRKFRSFIRLIVTRRR